MVEDQGNSGSGSLGEELFEQLQDLYHDRDERLRDHFDRSLSFADALFDRWERAVRLGFGTGASIYNSSLVFGEVSVGEDSWIGPWVLLDGSGGKLDIGRWCSISAGVHVYTHDTVLRSVSLGVIDRYSSSVSIGDGCYIGSQSIISAGTSIGDRCVIGANSFVNASIPERSIALGSPARIVGIVAGEGAETRLEYAGKS